MLQSEDFKPDYDHTSEYWKNTPATVDGMLGGYGKLSRPDSRQNLAFIKEFVEFGRIKTSLVCGKALFNLISFGLTHAQTAELA